MVTLKSIPTQTRQLSLTISFYDEFVSELTLKKPFNEYAL